MHDKANASLKINGGGEKFLHTDRTVVLEELNCHKRPGHLNMKEPGPLKIEEAGFKVREKVYFTDTSSTRNDVGSETSVVERNWIRTV